MQYTDRKGTLPYGGSFGHSSLVEMPAPIDHRLTDVDAGAEYSEGAVLFRAGYTGSFFHNDDTTVTFDNPFRVDRHRGDTLARAATRCRPSNSFVSVNGMASVKMPGRSRATAYVSMGQLKDAGDPLMPADDQLGKRDRASGAGSRQRRGADVGGEPDVRVTADAVRGRERRAIGRTTTTTARRCSP